MRAVALSALLVVVAGFALWLWRDPAGAHSSRTDERVRGPWTGEQASPSVPPADDTGTQEDKGQDGTRWEVVLLGPGDQPLPGVPVRGYPERKDYPTDANGRVVLPGPAGAKDRLMACPFEPHGRVLTAPRTVLRFPRLLPLELRAVDGATGQPLAGVELAVSTAGGDLAARDGVIAASPCRRAGWRDVVLRVRTAGWATREGLQFKLPGGISAIARRVVATVPLHREFEWTLELPRGYRAKGAGLGTTKIAAAFEPGARSGVVRVRGVPFLEGEEAFVVVAGEGRESMVHHEMTAPAATTLVDSGDRIEDAPFKGPPNNMIGLGGSRRVKKVGSMRVSVRRRDGSTAEGLRIRVGTSGIGFTGADGIAELGGLPPGTYPVFAGAPGFVPASGEATVVTGQVTEVVLTEPAGWTLQVRVRDQQGKPWRFVRIDVTQSDSKVPYGIVRDGVQYVPLLTGADGLLVLPDLGPERVRIEAALPGAGTTATVSPDHDGILDLTVAR